MSSGNKFIGWFWAGLSRSFVGDKIDREPAPCILKESVSRSPTESRSDRSIRAWLNTSFLYIDSTQLYGMDVGLA